VLQIDIYSYKIYKVSDQNYQE